MVKLTADLINGAAQCTNPIRERELDLSEYKIPMIENLGATLDQFDTINFTNNEIRKIDNFPLSPRLKSLLFNNNRIVRIADSLEETLPNLTMLILTNNNIQELADIEQLTGLQTLEMMSFLHNPVVAKPNYRLFVIHKFSNLKVLDFRKVKMRERETASQLFKTKRGKDQLKEIEKKAKTFVPGGNLPADKMKSNAAGLTPEQVKNIKMAISKATTLEEIERLNTMLRTGQIPGGSMHSNGNGVAKNGNQIEEMDED